MISRVDAPGAHDLSRARFARLRPARFARGLAARRNAVVLALSLARSLRSLAPRSLRSRVGCAQKCGCPCAPIASAPLPLPAVGGLCVRSGLPRRFAPPLPRRVALPLRGLLWRPAPSWAPLWRPLSLAAVLAPRALAVSAGHPRSLRGRGLPPSPPSPLLLGARCSPFPPSLAVRWQKGYRTEKARKPARYTPAHSSCPLAHPGGGKRLGHYLSATAQKKPVSQPATPPPTPPAPSHAPRGKSG